ncbi:MAG: hypothetical protein ACR2PK_05405 [Acidimicrobiales bacterium]
MLVAKGRSSDEVAFWAGLCVDASPDLSNPIVCLDVRADLEERFSLTRYRFAGDDQRCFYHGHKLVVGLEPGREHEVRATVVGLPGVSTSCRFRTLPAEIGDRGLKVVLASCYDADNDPEDHISGAFARIVEGSGMPDATMLVGDQVYLDAPWHEFRRFTRNDPRLFYLSKYWDTWGGGRTEQRLAGLLSGGANWFLPDDHEFWNNFPHATPLALHSFRNWRHIFKARLARGWHRLARGGDWPDSLVEPPDPSEWDTWSRAAFELFGSFQTPSEGGDVSRGSDDDQKEQPPLIPPVQVFDVAPARFVMVDTRTRRSRSARAPSSKFADDETVSQIVRLAGEPAAGLFFLVVAQPMFRRPRRYSGIGDRIRASFDTDRGLEDYPDQFIELWQKLVDARSGRPLVVLAGDIHRSSVGIAEDLSAVEVVSSPMALVSGVATWGRISRLWSGPKLDPHAGFPLSQLFPGERGELRRVFATDIEGLGTLDLQRTSAPDEFTLTVRWEPRSKSTRPPVPIAVVMRTGEAPGRPGSVSLADKLD